MTASSCYIGVDVGLTATKAAAFDDRGHELVVVSARTPRVIASPRRHDVDMVALNDTVLDLLLELTGRVAALGLVPAGIGVAGHGNGLYPVDDRLQPAGRAIASSDSRAQPVVDALESESARRLARRTGSIAWAAQPSVLLRWLADHEPETYRRTRWVLSCKDWVTFGLTGRLSSEFSDASAFGMVDLNARDYAPAALELVGLPPTDLERFPPLSRSDEVVGALSAAAAASTGLPAGLPVIAGCMDCVAGTLGAGGGALGDMTVIVGTWAINAVVAPAVTPAPELTLSALLPDPAHMLSMEVAPTSAANLDWLATVLAASTEASGETTAALVEEAAGVPAGAAGLVFLPFVNGAPEHPAASGTFLGLSGMHRRAHLTRAVLEGVAQYHRVQLERVLGSGADIGDRPWRLAGGGARSQAWAQIFADVLRVPVERQLTRELGARGVASLLGPALGHDQRSWSVADSSRMLVHPGQDQDVYERQASLFDACLEGLTATWESVDLAR